MFAEPASTTGRTAFCISAEALISSALFSPPKQCGQRGAVYGDPTATPNSNVAGYVLPDVAAYVQPDEAGATLFERTRGNCVLHRRPNSERCYGLSFANSLLPL